MIDIYSLTCYLFVVLVMVEYAVVLLLNDRVRKEQVFKTENKVIYLFIYLFIYGIYLFYSSWDRLCFLYAIMGTSDLKNTCNRQS